MSEQKAKLFMAAFSAICAVSLLVAASYSIFPTKEGVNASPMASPTRQPTMEPSTMSTTIPTPTASPSTSSYSPIPILVDISPDPNYTGSPRRRAYSVGRGESISLEVNVTSYYEIEYTVPLYLAIVGFENKGSGYIVIATPPAPYSSQLPWPSKYVQQSNDTLPLTATFDINPLTIEPMGNAISKMTLKAAANAVAGSYHIAIDLDKQSHRGDTGFEVIVEP